MSVIEQIISVIAPAECLGCGSEGAFLCTACQKLLPRAGWRSVTGAGEVWAASFYEGNAKQLVQLLKFHRAKTAAKDIGAAIAANLPAGRRPAVVTYVPTATKRLRQRGYDHAALIAKAVSHNIGVPCLPLLARSGQERQLGQSQSVRTQQLQQAFRARRDCHGLDILLIDDVLTTGGTLRQANRVLKAAGASRVSMAVFAAAGD